MRLTGVAHFTDISHLKFVKWKLIYAVFMFINLLCSNVNKTLRITTLVVVFITVSGNFMLLFVKKFRILKKVGLFLTEWVRGLTSGISCHLGW